MASAPTPAARAGLERRLGAIAFWHRPAGQDVVKPWIDLMLGTLLLKAEDGDDAELRKRAYYLAMADLPPYAVQAACTAALRAKVGDKAGKWAPKPGELHVAAERHMEVLLRERADINRILSAKVRDEPTLTDDDRAERMARVKAQVEAVKERAIGIAHQDAQARPEKPRVDMPSHFHAVRARINHDTPVRLSQAALDTLPPHLRPAQRDAAE